MPSGKNIKATPGRAVPVFGSIATLVALVVSMFVGATFFQAVLIACAIALLVFLPASERLKTFLRTISEDLKKHPRVTITIIGFALLILFYRVDSATSIAALLIFLAFALYQWAPTPLVYGGISILGISVLGFMSGDTNTASMVAVSGYYILFVGVLITLFEHLDSVAESLTTSDKAGAQLASGAGSLSYQRGRDSSLTPLLLTSSPVWCKSTLYLLKRRLRIDSAFVFSILGAIVVLWQLLIPGYMLTLDMVFGPRVLLVSSTGEAVAAYPVWWALQFLANLMPGWVIQKVVLLLLVFLLFYIPLRLYPLASRYGEKYLAAVLFAINPFVYERLLAGQWLILFGYVFLGAALSTSTYLFLRTDIRDAIYLAFWLTLAACFSIHMWTIGIIGLVLLWTVQIAVHIVKRNPQIVRRLAFQGMVAFGAAVLLASYWIVPTILAHAPLVSSFDHNDTTAFATADDPTLGVLGHVLTLYGFWGEHEYWANYFTLPYGTALWLVSGLAILFLILRGFLGMLSDARTRPVALGLTLSAGAAAIFSAGIASGTVHDINAWLFAHVPLWKGFRDSEKWTAILALVYAYFAAAGASVLTDIFSGARMKRLFVGALCALPLLYTPTMLFGLNGQLQPVWYPSSWERAEEITRNEPDCKMLILPWHLYYTPVFANRRLVSNPAPYYFSCTPIVSADPGIDGIPARPQGLTLEKYQRIDTIVRNNNARGESAAAVFAEEGIRYVLFSNDEIHDDPYRYLWLNSPRFSRVYIDNVEGVALYRVI